MTILLTSSVFPFIPYIDYFFSKSPMLRMNASFLNILLKTRKKTEKIGNLRLLWCRKMEDMQVGIGDC